MALLKNKEGGGGSSEKTIRPRSATYVLNRRKPTEISRSISKPEVKPIEEWKRPGEDIKVLLPKEEVEELEEIQTPRRRLWSTHRMKGLREDLANNGSLESVIQMGTELLEGLSSADSDEVAYREEQALFWYEKAAERGSCEAKSLIQQMLNKNSTGINASNITSLREVLSLSEEELTGKRIGDLLYHSLGGSEDDHLLSGRLVNKSKLGSVESLSRSDLITSGKEFMKGRLVPEIDAKLISAETPSSFISFLFNQYILLYYFLQNLMTDLILKNTCVYIFALGVIYRYWMFISYTFLLQGAVLVLFSSSSFILLHKPLQKKRFNVWTKLWQKSSSKSAITQKEVNLAHHNFNLGHNVRFVFAACLSIGIAEIFWGFDHPLAHYLTASLVPLLLLFQSNWTTKLVYVGIISAASTLDISVPFFHEEEETMEDLYLGLLVGTAILFLSLWSKLGHELLPHLIFLKILDFYFCASQFHYIFTGLCVFISLYYGLTAFKKVTTLIIGTIIFAFFILSNKNSIPLSQLTLQKYTSVCPSHFECSKFEGLKVNWTALEVISVKQKLLRHPLNEILLSISQFQESRLFHELDVRYCDVSLVQEWSEAMTANNDDDDENVEDSLFSFNFGSPTSEEEKGTELQRKSIRARIWRTELCKSMTEGSVIDIIGITSSMTSEVDIIVHQD